MEPYRCFLVKGDCAEDNLYELHDLGALGTEIIDDQTLRCFFADNDESSLTARLYCLSQGWECSEIELCAGKNWVQACEEIWTPLKVGDLQIYPLRHESDRREQKSNTIYIIPGEGFGTGHHASTRLPLLLIQELKRLGKANIRSILDFGTGNGILAMAAALAFPESHITAIDNDACALRNAAENIALNQNKSTITLQNASIEQMEGQYDLIVANIYAEVLCAHENNLRQRVKQGGHLVLAGIMESHSHLIRSAYADQIWEHVRQLADSGWDGFMFKKR